MSRLLHSPIETLSGVGETRRQAYARLGIRTVEDLLYHFPRAYENRGDVRLLSETGAGRDTDGFGTREGHSPPFKVSTILTVSVMPRISRLKNRQTLLKFRAFDDSGTCEIVFFNQEYLKDTFPIGAVFRFYGKVERVGSGYTMTSPAFEPFTESIPLPPLYPVYPLTAGISQKLIQTHIGRVLPAALSEMEDDLPETVRESAGLCTIGYALREIHRPTDFASLHKAKKRLAFDEFFRFALGMGVAGRSVRTDRAPACAVSDRDLRDFTARLPYELTGAQKRAIREIRTDMAGHISMNRILVGDVGCGKTVCAAAAVYLAVKAGHQAAVMAPTGILAAQHAADLIPLFEGFGMRAALLTGHTRLAEKRRIYEALASDDREKRLDIVIGTQALLSEGVSFSSPALIVTDEQHRFGVRQRAVLSEKNRHAHRLVMSATPIPRTLALALYGNLDVSRIDEMPPGRQRVDTFVVDERYRARLDAFIAKNVRSGGQVYIVCPAIDEKHGEEEEGLIPLDADFSLWGASPASFPVSGKPERKEPAGRSLSGAVQYAKELAERLPELKIAVVHGQMKPAEKDSVMEAFTAGDIQVLVSTTVIEVGVNVPNACLMIVENAEQFGLSQLHQLRGRVGRGQRKSYCVLVQNGGGKTASERLQVMHTTYDGYRIAEQDLAQRGPGDFLASAGGTEIRQSGGFRLTDTWSDTGLMEQAFAAARQVWEEDPELVDHPALRSRLQHLYDDAGDIFN